MFAYVRTLAHIHITTPTHNAPTSRLPRLHRVLAALNACDDGDGDNDDDDGDDDNDGENSNHFLHVRRLDP